MLKGVAGGDEAATAVTSLTGDVTGTGPGATATTLTTAQPAVHTWALKQTFTSTIDVNAGTAIPANGSATARIGLSSTAAFGIYFGSGAPTGLTAAKGSLYLRSDGSGINDRAYINTDSGTTWTAIVTVG